MELERPRGGDRRSSLARHFVFGDHEHVIVPRADTDTAFPTAGDFAGDGAIEEAVPKSFDDDLLDMRERLRKFPGMCVVGQSMRKVLHDGSLGLIRGS